MKNTVLGIFMAVMVVFTASANPRFKNKKHFKKDFDPNKKVEAPLTTLSALNKGPQYKNGGHEHDVSNGSVVNVDDANNVKGPQYKNQKHFARPSSDAQPEQQELANVE